MAYSRLAERFNLSEYAYAHRGLWSPGDASENSLDAFARAADHGLGIEFDVRPSADGIPIVFHDATLDRMTHEVGPVENRSAKELLGLPLKGGGEIVSLQDMLAHWPGRTPLLCELKIDGQTDPQAFAEVVCGLLLDHNGPVAAMSFSTDTVLALSDQLMRGQLIAPSALSGRTGPEPSTIHCVDYLACHVSDAPEASIQAARPQMPVVTWTVTSEAQCSALSSLTESQIFEGFDPALAKRHILNT